MVTLHLLFAASATAKRIMCLSYSALDAASSIAAYTSTEAAEVTMLTQY